MLTITVPGVEHYDEAKQEFVTVGDVVLELEHSLVSLSKWESKFEKAFLEAGERSPEELIGYIKAMTLTPEVPPEVYDRFSAANYEEVNAYINAKMTATWFHEDRNSPKSREVVTSELIYYWMTVFTIPFTCETWHLNRLFTLIRIANIKQEKPKKQARADTAAQRRELNAKRKAALGTTG